MKASFFSNLSLMNKETFLHIPQPCDENWNTMTPAEQGRFCQSCCKTVVDFSNMSDKEVLNILAKAPGKTCGRFAEEQLHRPLYHEAPVVLKPYKVFLSAFIPTFLLVNTAISQNAILPNKKSELVTAKKGEVVVNTICGGGKVFEKPAVQSMRIPLNTSAPKTRLLVGKVKSVQPVSAANPLTALTPAQPIKIPNSLTVASIEKPFTGRLGGVLLYSKVTVVDTVKAFVRKALNPNAFKVYANPVKAGSPINLQFKEAGRYTVQLLDRAGRLYFSEVLQSSDSNQALTVTIPSNVATGHYFIRAINQDKKNQYVDNIIVN